MSRDNNKKYHKTFYFNGKIAMLTMKYSHSADDLMTVSKFAEPKVIQVKIMEMLYTRRLMLEIKVLWKVAKYK